MSISTMAPEQISTPSQTETDSRGCLNVVEPMPKSPAAQLYRPLDKSRAEFRLLRLEVTNEDEPLRDEQIASADEGRNRCRLEVYSLAEDATSTPQWQALSYEWEQAAADEQIEVNGHVFLVRPNLHQFLQQMMQERCTSWIYIDAICINQEDLTEREQQVSLMSRIYRQAEEVVAWIPEPDGRGAWMRAERERIEAMIQQLPACRTRMREVSRELDVLEREVGSANPSASSQQRKSEAVTQKELHCEQMQLDKRIAQLRKCVAYLEIAQSLVDEMLTDCAELKVHPCDADQQVVLCYYLLADGLAAADIRSKLAPPERWRFMQYRVSRSSYWSRLWIVQEVLLARRLTIRVGPYSLDPEDLWAWYEQSEDNGTRSLLENIESHIDILSNGCVQESFFTKTRKAAGNVSVEEFEFKSASWAQEFPSARSLFENPEHVSKIVQESYFDKQADESIAYARTLYFYRWGEQLQRPPSFSFCRALDSFSNQVCTHFHDRVYGVRALSRTEIPIDYRLTRIQLFMMMWAEYLLSSYRPDINGPDLKDLSLASFFPDRMGVALSGLLELSCTDPVVYTVAQMIVFALYGATVRAQMLMAHVVLLILNEQPAASRGFSHFFNWRPRNCLNWSYALPLCTRLLQHVLASAAMNEQMTFHGTDGDIPETKRYLEWCRVALATAENLWGKYERYDVDDSERMIDDQEGWVLVATGKMK